MEAQGKRFSENLKASSIHGPVYCQESWDTGKL